MKAEPWLSIVGVGENGIEGLTPAATRLVEAAATVFGGSRHLALVAPLLRGESIAWLSPLDATIPLIQARRGTPTCVLASGDPFHYGIGATLARHLGPEDFVCLPQPSAFSLAAARLGWALQDTVCLSLHGRALERVIPELQPGVRLLALSWDGSTPRSLAALLAARGFGASILHVCEALGGPRERIGAHVAATFHAPHIADLNILGVEVRAEGSVRVRPLTAGLPDDWFEHDGQITKAPIRAVTLSALAPHPGETLWDIGAGSGSIGIEWLLCHGSMRAMAVEQHAGRAARIGRNAAEWGVAERLVVRQGRAPECLRDLPVPDAIFIGGGATADGLLDLCRATLSPGGRLVVNAVTIETQAMLARSYRNGGGDLFTLGVAQAEPIGAFHGLRPSMPVMQWRWVKPVSFPIAIGVGCRKGCAASAITAIVARACDGLSMEGARVFSLDAKQHEPGLHEAAAALALPLGFFSVEALRPMMPAVATRSARVEAAVGIPAVAEAAALAGAGPGGRLIVRRIAADGDLRRRYGSTGAPGVTVHFIGAGPGAPDLITVRGRDLIARCPVCLYAGSLVPRALLQHCPPETRIVDTAPLSLDEIIAECAAADAAGHDVARLHSGDLSIWSALGEQLRRLDALGIAYTVTPGVPAFAAAAALLGRELTLPGVVQSVVLTRTPGRASAMPERETLARFAETRATLAIHLSIHALDEVVRALLPHYGAPCPVCIVVRASWPDERILRGTLATIAAAVAADPVERTALILVGEALGDPQFGDSALYSPDYRRRFRGGAMPWRGGQPDD